PGAAALRVAIDGPELAGPGALATAVAERLPALGRAAVVVPATGFYRPASVRLEHGRTDAYARYTDWLDAGALTREVLAPVGPGGARRPCRPTRPCPGGPLPQLNSPAIQRSRMKRAIDTGGGRARGPAPARSSSRVNQRASSISSWSRLSGNSPSGPGSARATK